MTPQGLPVRERTVVLLGLVFITALSWAYMWYLARDPMAMCMVNMNPWSAADLFALFSMWAVMMVAMMIPSASPMILAFAGVNRTRRAQSLPYVATSAFVWAMWRHGPASASWPRWRRKRSTAPH